MADLQEDVNQGYQAARAMEVIRFYFEELKAEAYAAFLDCPVRDQEALSLIKLQVNAIEGLERKLQSAVDNGQMAAEEIRRLNDG